MKRWLGSITMVMGCSWGASAPAPQVAPPAPDCTLYDTALRELKPWESAGNLVSAVDAGFAVKRMAGQTATLQVAGTLRANDFAPPSLRITLHPRGAEEVERRVPSGDTTDAKEARENCQAGVHMRTTGEAVATVVWEGRTLEVSGPITVSAWGPLPSEMTVRARLQEWELGGTAPQDWQELVCLGMGQQVPCRFGPAYVDLHGTLASPELTVGAALKGQPSTVPLHYAWSVPVQK